MKNVIIAESGEAYDKLIKSMDEQTKNLLELSIIYERERSKTKVLVSLLSKFLQEFEGKFSSDETCDSPEIARDYLDAAIFMRDNFGRKENCIREVEAWYSDYVPFGK